MQRRAHDLDAAGRTAPGPDDAAQATLRMAYQDHQEAAALATAAVTYEAQALATVEAQEALPLWYWLLPER